MHFCFQQLLILHLAAAACTLSVLSAMESESLPHDCQSDMIATKKFSHLLIFRTLIPWHKSNNSPEALLPAMRTMHTCCDTMISAEILQICLAEADTSFTHMRNSFGETILHCCAREAGYLDCAKTILKTTTTPDKTWELLTALDKWKETALHWAARNGYVKLVNELIATATTLNKAARFILRKDQWGETALHVAAFHGQAHVVTALLHAADKYAIAGKLTDKRNNLGMTALDCAIDYRFTDIVTTLAQYAYSHS